MSAEGIRHLLDDLASDVSAPQLAERTWTRSRVIRRRRRQALAGAVLATTVLVGLPLMGTGEPVAKSDAPSRQVLPYRIVDGRVVDIAPAPEDQGALPVLPTRLGARPVSARPIVDLSADPVKRALLLKWTPSPDVLYVYGDDQGIRTVDDLNLKPVADAHGSPGQAFSDSSLSPDGTRAAFPQRDEIVLLDLTTAEVKRHAVAGPNARTVWLQDGRLQVWQAERALLLDPETGRKSPSPSTGLAAAGPADASGLFLMDGGHLGWRSPAGVESRYPVTSAVDAAGCLGTVWRYRGVAACNVSNVQGEDETAVVAFEAESGWSFRALQLPGAPGSIKVVSWLDSEILLIQSRLQGANRILGWNTRSGQLFLVSELPDAAISVGPIGLG